MSNGNRWQSMNWQDPFGLEQQLNDEQRMVRDSAAQYARAARRCYTRLEAQGFRVPELA